MIRKITLILAFATSFGTAGSDIFFRHLDSRTRELAPEVSVRVTARWNGLQLRCPKLKDIEFPRKESFVIVPGGAKLLLPFMRMGEGDPDLKGYWDATTKAPLQLVNGIYKYHIVLIIDGVRFEFDHSIEVHIQPRQGLGWTEVQLKAWPQPDPDQSATKPADKAPEKIQPSTPTSKDAPR